MSFFGIVDIELETQASPAQFRQSRRFEIKALAGLIEPDTTEDIGAEPPRQMIPDVLIGGRRRE